VGIASGGGEQLADLASTRWRTSAHDADSFFPFFTRSRFAIDRSEDRVALDAEAVLHLVVDAEVAGVVGGTGKGAQGDEENRRAEQDRRRSCHSNVHRRARARVGVIARGSVVALRL
jgi:hypothetical protein